MATFSELQESVRRRLIDVPPRVEDEIPTLVNDAIMEAQRRNNFNAMRWSQDYLLPEGEKVVARPQRMKQLRGRPYLSVNEASGFKLRVLDFSDYTTAETDSYLVNGTPRFLVTTDGDASDDWFVYPSSDGRSEFDSGAYRVRIFYWRYFAPLAGANERNWISDNVNLYIIAEATARAFLMNWEEERAAISRQEANTKLAIVVAEDRRAISSGKDTLRPTGGVFTNSTGSYGYDYLGRWSGRRV